ncbi:MAG: hypothetical protein HEP71_24520 [Roseivirga sp.]|nr:hypothetical protein [Roseivirga sp.]
MAQPFKIQVNFQDYSNYILDSSNNVQNGDLINLSQISCLNIPDQGEFGIHSTDSGAEIQVCMNGLETITNNGQLDQVLPLFYFPNVGSFSYRSGNWFITELSFSMFEGKTPDRESVYGRDIGVNYSIQSGITSDKEVDFRIHFEIEFHDILPGGATNLRSNPCFIDPKLKVSQPPTPPVA